MDLDDYMDNYLNKSVKFFCNACGKSGMMTKPPKGENCYCPYCGSIIRGNIIEKNSWN